MPCWTETRLMAALLLLSPPALECAGLKGIVIESATGRPLARALVRLETLAASGSPVAAASAVTDRTGQFSFPRIAPGGHFLSAERRGFARAKYGQKRRWGPGKLIQIGEEEFPFIELRLARLGAISGTIYDENLVGLPDQKVVLYRGTKPPLELAGSATTDDRGWYRIGGLAPGRYWVRAAGGALEDGQGILPTFFPRATVLGEARAVEADLDRETGEINIEPIPGRTGSLELEISGPPGPANLILSSDTGRRQQTVNVPGSARFDGLPPANYELLAEAPRPAPPFQPSSTWLMRYIDRDERVTIELKQNPAVTLGVEGGEASLAVRRKDLAGEGPELAATARQLSLAVGTWEVLARPTRSAYYASLSANNMFRGRRREDSSHEIELLANSNYIRAEVTLSAKAASLRGTVRSRGEPAEAAPVFLYPIDEGLRKRNNGPRVTWTKAGGAYEFSGLAPGDYLVASSFEFENPTAEMLAEAKALTVQLKESETGAADLELYEAE